MNINLQNCEAWFLDFFEGNLSPEQVEEMFAFLVIHPEMREVFDSFEEVSFDPEKHVTFDAKDLLKKNTGDAANLMRKDFEVFAARYVDGDLNDEEKKEFEILLEKDAALRREVHLMQQAVLPAEVIRYTDKAALKKNSLHLSVENIDEWICRFIDQELSAEEHQHFKEYRKAHPETEQLIQAFVKTALPADEVILEDKASLYRHALTVNAGNIDDWSIRTVEGLLNPEERDVFFKAIASDPELKKVFDNYTLTKLQADTAVRFEDADTLKRKAVVISENNFDELAVRYAEGLLNEPETAALMAYVAARPEKQAALQLYLAVKVTPDTDIVFEDKASLRRKKRGAFYFLMDVRFAAAAVLFIVFAVAAFIYLSKDPLKNDVHIAGNGVIRQQHVIPQPEVPAPVQNNTQQLAAQQNTPESNHTAQTGTGADTRVSPHPVAPPVRSVENATFAALNVSGYNKHSVQFSDAVFSDTYYNSLSNLNTTQRASASDKFISPVQYAMRWTKDRLDRRPADVDEDEVVEMLADAHNQQVTGWDLTVSAINKVSDVTGTRMRLDKTADGKVFSIGKYEVCFGGR
ncbi:MAG: hypothetical protein Fur0041_01650 [Bacteroidia bacterium]